MVSRHGSRVPKRRTPALINTLNRTAPLSSWLENTSISPRKYALGDGAAAEKEADHKVTAQGCPSVPGEAFQQFAEVENCVNGGQHACNVRLQISSAIEQQGDWRGLMSSQTALCWNSEFSKRCSNSFNDSNLMPLRTLSKPSGPCQSPYGPQ